jgi:hypothetical protein
VDEELSLREVETGDRDVDVDGGDPVADGKASGNGRGNHEIDPCPASRLLLVRFHHCLKK